MTLRAAVYEHLLTFKVTHFVASAVAGTPAIPATSNPSKSAGENGGADDPLTEVVPVHEPWVPTVQDVRRPANDKNARLLDKDSLLPRNRYDYTSAPLDLTSVPFEEVGELARMSFSNNSHATKFVFFATYGESGVRDRMWAVPVKINLLKEAACAADAAESGRTLKVLWNRMPSAAFARYRHVADAGCGAQVERCCLKVLRAWAVEQAKLKGAKNAQVQQRAREAQRLKVEADKREQAAVLGKVAKRHQEAFTRQHDADRGMSAEVVGIDPLGEEEEDSVLNPAKDPDACLELYNETNGHEISWDAEHPPPKNAPAAEWRDWGERVLHAINEHAATGDTHELSQSVEKVLTALGPTAELCACASCGVRIVDDVPRQRLVNELPECFQYTAGELARREKLGHVSLVGDDAQLRSADARVLECSTLVRGTRYHLHDNLVEDREGEASVKLCKKCADPSKDLHGNFEPPPFSLAAGWDFGNLELMGLPEPSELEKMVLSDVRVYGRVVKIVADSNSQKADWQHKMLRGHFITFIHSGPAEFAAYVRHSIAERVGDVERKVPRGCEHHMTSFAHVRLSSALVARHR